ncbi:MAG TPA: hypothetical protein ENJ97_04615 [Planctomycetes bacterium]|nr:hypothetical protein [Planctomycetota bacterium]
MSGLWSSPSVGGPGGIQPAAPAVKRAESEAEKEKKKELFQRALGGKKKEKKKKEGKEASPRGEERKERAGEAGAEPKGTGGSGHRVDVLA